MRPAFIIAASLIATASIGAVIAQPAPPAADTAAADRVAKLVAADANQDGKWNKTEWAAAGRREMGFNFCDGDKDGFVTKPELKTCAEKAKAMGMGGN